MKIGLFAIGIGAAARPEVIREVAETGERVGFSTCGRASTWCSSISMSRSIRIRIAANFRSPPMPTGSILYVTLSFAAAVTSTIRLATGICLVPEHNPMVLAKVIASLESLAKDASRSGSASDGAPRNLPRSGSLRAPRATHSRIYRRDAQAMEPGGASHHGEFVNFDNAGSFPSRRKARGCR